MKTHQETRDHYQPVGAPQEAFVRDIAHLLWKMRRLNISSQLAFAEHPDTPVMAEARRDGWEGLGRYLQQTSGDTTRLESRIIADSAIYFAGFKKFEEFRETRS